MAEITTYYLTEESVVLFGSTDVTDQIESDVSVTGGAVKTTERSTLKGNTYVIASDKGAVTVSFDHRDDVAPTIRDSYAASTNTPATSPFVSTKYTTNYGDAGTPATITLKNVKTADSKWVNVVMTNVRGVSDDLTAMKGQVWMRKYVGTVSPDGIVETAYVA